MPIATGCSKMLNPRIAVRFLQSAMWRLDRFKPRRGYVREVQVNFLDYSNSVMSAVNGYLQDNQCAVVKLVVYQN